MTAAPTPGADADEREGIRHELAELYPGRWPLLLIRLCHPTKPHEHMTKDGPVSCEHPGKTPTERGWNADALARWELAEGAEERLAGAAGYVGRVGNIGLVIPPGVLVLDADTPSAVALLDRALPDAPMQESRPGRAHFVVAAPPGLEVKASVGFEIAPGVKVDLRVAGRSQIVVAPSQHPSGSSYTWKRTIFATIDALPECPAFIAEKLRASLHNGSGGAGGSAHKITKPGRGDYLYRLACRMRGRGHTETEIRAELHAENARHCQPPLSASEVDHHAESALKFPAGDRRAPGEAKAPETDAAEAEEHLTELGNARRLVRLHGADLRHVGTWGRWLAWDGARFAEDETGEAARRAKQTVRTIYGEAETADGPEERKRIATWAKASESASRINATLELARSEPEIAVSHAALDLDPWLLNVLNGTLDLRSAMLRPHDRGDLMTKRAPVAYDVDAEAPLWLEFLERVIPDKDVREFVQRAVGYSLTGDTGAQCVFFLSGHGANGKSTFIETVFSMLGDYALRTPAETLLARREGGIPNDVARLRGARFVAAVESGAGRRLAETRIKELTGGDTVSARFMRAEWFDFRPVAKLWISTNHRPVVRGTDEAIWRRIRLIEFPVTIPEAQRDPALPEKLRAELPGILAWAVEGCVAWRAAGLAPPGAVVTATQTYRAEQDVIGHFLEEKCAQGDGWAIGAGELFAAFRAWAEAAGEHASNQRAFGMALKERGFQNDRLGKARRWVWLGLGLAESPYGDPRADG